MAQRLTARNRNTGPMLWLLALATIVLASGSLLIVMWSPKALLLALIVGLMALVSRSIFVSVRESAHRRAEASSTLANTGLAIAAVAVAPLLAFALLWAALLLFLGMTWLLNAIGII